jgi:transposase
LIDESGLSTRPHKVRTWSPRGQTPILQHHFNWKSLSVIAGITFYSFYFQLHDKSIKSPQIVEFLCHLMRHVAGNLLIIWDGLPAHRSQLTQDFIASTEGRIVAARLPSYAPELNPVEYIWAHWKQHELPNTCPRDWWQLSANARRTLRRMRRRPRLIRAFWLQSELPL